MDRVALGFVSRRFDVHSCRAVANVSLPLQMLEAGEARWEPTLKAAIEAGDCSEVSFQEEMQRRMESTVLTLKSGSYSQRVQAEFLKELEDRAAAVFKQEE